MSRTYKSSCLTHKSIDHKKYNIGMRVLVFLFNFYIIHISLNAQEVFIFPTPQRVDLQQGSLRVKQLKFKSSIKIDAANLQWLQAFQPVSVGNRKMYTTIQVDKLTPSNNISQ